MLHDNGTSQVLFRPVTVYFGKTLNLLIIIWELYSGVPLPPCTSLMLLLSDDSLFLIKKGCYSNLKNLWPEM